MIDEQLIQKIKERLVSVYDPNAIYLFGSRVWGEPDKASDLDILIVLDAYKKDRFATMSDGHKALVDLDIAKDILVYDQAQFEELAASEESLCARVKQKGKKIYAKA